MHLTQKSKLYRNRNRSEDIDLERLVGKPARYVGDCACVLEAAVTQAAHFSGPATCVKYIRCAAGLLP